MGLRGGRIWRDLCCRVVGLVQYRVEGEVLARRAGEAESLVKKVRADSLRLEQDKEHLQGRVQLLEVAAASVDASRISSLEEASVAAASGQHALEEQKAHLMQLVEAAGKQAATEVADAREQAAEREQLMATTMNSLRQVTHLFLSSADKLFRACLKVMVEHKGTLTHTHTK